MEKFEKKELINRNYAEEILEILEQNISNEKKKELLSQYHESDIAEVLDELDDDLRKKLFELLDIETAGEVLLYSEDIEDIASNMKPEVLAEMLETMDSDDAIDVLDELDEEVIGEVVSLIEDEEVKEDLIAIMQYDEEVIGSEMSNNFIVISINDSIKSAMKKVISEAGENDNISNIYVLDENEKFYGVIELRDLIIAREGSDINKIIKKNYPYFYDTDLISESINKIKEYSLSSYPIIDKDFNLLGVITHDDALDATYEEFEDDYAKLAGISEEDTVSEGIFQSVKKRIPWLIILLILGLVQSFLMTGFEVVVASLPIIVFFQTLVLGMSGNTGTQSLAVTIRMISTTKQNKKMVLKGLLRELRVGFFNGLVLSIFASLFVFLFLRITNQGVVTETFVINDAIKAAEIVGFALLISMTLSSFVGSLVPIIFKKINIDPAVASGPFITTINDLTAMVIYYTLAGILFSIL